MNYVYVLKVKKRESFYIGSTNNLKRRLKEHRDKGDFELEYYEAYKDIKAARMREKRLKYYGSAWRALKKRMSSNA